MKKRTLLVSLAMVVGLLFTACDKGSNRNNDFVTTGVTTPGGLGTSCLNNGLNGINGVNNFNNGLCGTFNYNNGIFSNYPLHNGYYRGYYNNYYSGFNRCPLNSVPVYNAGLGLGCLPTYYLNSLGTYDFAYWNWNSVDFNFSLFGGINTFTGLGAGVLNSCVVGTASCAVGACVSISGGGIGICTL